MANPISTVNRSKPAAAEALADSTELPIARRTDVTVDELERLLLPYPAELYDGRIIYKMSNFERDVIHENVAYKIRSYLENNPVGLLSGNADYRLHQERKRDSRAPDISFVTNDRLPQSRRRYLPMAPDLAIEILSPVDSFDKVMEKVEEHLQAGVKIVWLIIRSTREVLACKPAGKHSVRDVLTAPELLPGFELPVQEIFAGVEVAPASE